LNEGFGIGLFSGSLNIVMWLGYLIVTSLYARVFGEYSVALLGLTEDGIWLHFFSSAVVLLFVLINFVGAAAVGSLELLVVSIKVLVLMGFGIMGLFTMNPQQLAMPVNFDSADLGNLLMASGVVFVSYEGFGLIANTAEDIRNPKKNLPVGLFLSIFIVAIIYLMVSLAVIGNLSINEIKEAKEYVLAEAATPIMGSMGFTIIGIAALFSTASAINATIYGPVNMLQETAKAGEISSIFRRKLFNHESGYALLIMAVVVLIFSNLLEIEPIAESGSLIFLMIYTSVNVVNLKLRLKTSSNAVIAWLGIISTSTIFVVLYYYLWLQQSLSAYLFPVILFLAFVYQWFHQLQKK